MSASTPVRSYDRRNVYAIISGLTNFEIHYDSKAESYFLIFYACIMLKQYIYILCVIICIILTGLAVPDDFNVTATVKLTTFYDAMTW
jgi:hypothetical protein